MKITISSPDAGITDYAVRIIEGVVDRTHGRITSIVAGRECNNHVRHISLTPHHDTIEAFKQTNLPLGGMVVIKT